MSFLTKLINSKWIQHLAFWVLSIYVIGSYFSISSIFKFIDIIYALVFHIPLLLLVYVNLNLLVPRFLQVRKYFLFLVLSAANLGLAYLVHELVFEIVLPLIPSIYMVSFIDWQILVQIFVIYLTVSTLFKLSRSWYTLQNVEKEKLALELSSLKTQVNPHFFFNSLNSIYSLALKKDDRTPEVVLELSELMRYMLYEVGDEKVPLTKEIEIMNAYLDLQRLRADESTRIDFKVEGEVEDKMIAPLLFFPLIENSFKHGVKGTSQAAYVDIRMSIHENELEFEISNNQGQVDDVEHGKFGGIGLENVRKRLNLIYSSADLQIQNTLDMFTVKIKLTL